jgi:hypothetical protein
MRTIYYAPKIENSGPKGFEHPLLEDEIFIPIKPYLTYYKEHHEKHVYWECPAWKKYYKNSFVIFSQSNIEVKFSKEDGVVDPETYVHMNIDGGFAINDMNLFGRSMLGEDPSTMGVIHKPLRPPYHGLIIGQLHQHYFFWTEPQVKTLWIEILPTTIPIPGAELVSAEYPVGRWMRPTICAYKFNEPTIIKRGDPIGILRFRNSRKYDENFRLERKDIPQNVMRKAYNHSILKKFLPKKSWDFIKDEPKESKCPFSKLGLW